MLSLPRVIHQTWKHSLPNWPLDVCAASFRKHNPSWEYRFWTDLQCEDFFRQELPDLLATYEHLPAGIYRADLFKAAVLFVHGGIFADLDVECLRPLDELLALCEWTEWEVCLGRDHPDNEDYFHGNSPTWPNAFIVARPQSKFLEEVLRRIRKHPLVSRDYYGASRQTGVGLFSAVRESTLSPLEDYRILEMPWQWIYPLPQLKFRGGIERYQHRKLIRERAWHKGFQISIEDGLVGDVPGEPPFVVHYWYPPSGIVVTRDTRAHFDLLLQTDGEIVEARLQPWAHRLGDRIEAAGQTLTSLAEWASHHSSNQNLRPEARCVLLEQARTGETCGVDFATIAEGVLNGLAVDLVQSSATDLSIEQLCSWLQEGPVCFVIYTPETVGWLTGLLEELLLNRDCAQPLLILFLGAFRSPDELNIRLIPLGFLPRCTSGGHLWERPRDAVVSVPRVIHSFDQSAHDPVDEQSAEAWLRRNENNGWTLRRWQEAELSELIRMESPNFLDTFFSYKDSRLRWGAARFFVLRRHGGVVIVPGSRAVQGLEDLAKDSTAFLVAEDRKTLTTGRRAIDVYEAIIGSEPRHPIWSGIEIELEQRFTANYAESVGEAMLAERLEDATRFLSRKHWPKLVPAAGLKSANSKVRSAAPCPTNHIGIEKRGFDPKKRYDIDVMLPIHYVDKFKHRLEFFKCMGLVNLGTYIVHVTLVGSMADALASDAIIAGWPPGVDVTFFAVDSSRPVSKINTYYSWLKSAGLNALWHLRVDDDSVTDISGLLSYANARYHTSEPVQLMSSPIFWSRGIPMFRELLEDMGVPHSRFYTEYESGLSSQSAIKQMTSSIQAMDFLARTKEFDMPGDWVPAVAMRLARVPLETNSVTTCKFARDDFSLTGGRYCHIHYVDWHDEKFTAMLNAFNSGEHLHAPATLKLPLNKPIDFGKGIGQSISQVTLSADGVILDENLHPHAHWSWQEEALHTKWEQGNLIVFDRILSHEQRRWLLGRDTHARTLHYLRVL